MSSEDAIARIWIRLVCRADAAQMRAEASASKRLNKFLGDGIIRMYSLYEFSIQNSIFRIQNS